MGDLVPLPLEGDPLSTVLNGLDSPLSRKTMCGCIRTMQGLLGHELGSMAPHEVGTLRVMMGKYEPATGNKFLSALRGYMRVAARMGMARADTMAELGEAKNFKGSRLPAGRMLSEEEIASMVRLCDSSTAIGARDGAMLAILRAGLRRAELVGLDLASYSPDVVRVLGKGDKERDVPMPEGAAALIASWLTFRGTAPGALLCRICVLPRIERICTQTVADRVEALWERAGSQGGSKPTPHDFRRTLASNLFDLNVDGKTVQDLLGHSLFETTARYDRRPEGRKAKAMALVSMEPAKK